jgi:pimeloyl-ACP methyl ester carboxylesterase
MTTTPGTTATTGTLETNDAHLYYEVRGKGPLVALIGAPAGAADFGPLADLLSADHTVLTTDPRGIGRSPVHDPEQDSTPGLRAADLAQLIGRLGTGPATVVGSSGGAVTALALAQDHPESVHTAVAHEAPLYDVLADRTDLYAKVEDMISTYADGDVIGAWRLFMKAANIAIPDEALDYMFGGDRDPQAGADERRWFFHELRGTVSWRPDTAALRSGPTRLVIGIGEDSAGELCDRSSRALAAELGLAPTMFPGGHTAMGDDPAGFAVRLREVLATAG